MNNEPVAWIDPCDLERLPHHDCWVNGQEHKNSVPLYTHPVKYCPSENNEAYEKGFIDGMDKMTKSAVHRAVEGMAVKELTDEEIDEAWKSVDHTIEYSKYRIEIARAILRKAQEK
jgi:hypothetical protein